VDDEDLTHINLLKYEPEEKQKIIVEIPFLVVNLDKSPGAPHKLNKTKLACSTKPSTNPKP
jgi:hypothetical protein